MIYLIPTKTGALFLIATFTILILGAGYSNNLVNLLSFFMMSLLFIALILTRLQLKELLLESVQVDAAYADGDIMAYAIVRNVSNRVRTGIQAQFREGSPRPVEESPPVHATSIARIPFSKTSGKRGLHQAQELKLSSIYPFGLFYAWQVVPYPFNYVVFPKAIYEVPLPSDFNSGEAEGAVGSEFRGGDDFRGHRAYVPGDSPRQIDWKAYARGRPLMIKELNEGDQPALVLDWDSLRGMETEARLSQLSAWVQEALHLDIKFSLKLPHLQTEASSGFEHAQNCLFLLALYEEVKP